MSKAADAEIETESWTFLANPGALCLTVCVVDCISVDAEPPFPLDCTN